MKATDQNQESANIQNRSQEAATALTLQTMIKFEEQPPRYFQMLN